MPRGRCRDPTGRADEVVDVALGLEADDVGRRDALDDLAPPRQAGKQVWSGERDVEEEANADVGTALAEQRRHELEMVVVHSYGGAGCGGAGDRLRKRRLARSYAAHHARRYTGGRTRSWYSGHSVPLDIPSW